MVEGTAAFKIPRQFRVEQEYAGINICAVSTFFLLSGLRTC